MAVVRCHSDIFRKSIHLYATLYVNRLANRFVQMNRTEFLDIIGRDQKRGALNFAVLSQLHCDGYDMLTVEYDAEPEERIKAYLFIPTTIARKVASIFCHHQHASNFAIGKSEPAGLDGDEDQAIAPELTRRGYVVLVPDAIAFEERNWSFPTGNAEYHELATRLVQGRSLIAKVLGDVSAGIDLLAELPQTDPERIGFIGHSYGSRMAIWAPAFDQRIKVSVSNCGCVNYKDSLSRAVGIQPEFCVPGIMQKGDIEDIVRLIAPRALLISATDDDKYSQGARRIYDYATDAFPDGQIECRVWPGKHSFTENMREVAYRFLDEHLSVM